MYRALLLLLLIFLLPAGLHAESFRDGHAAYAIYDVNAAERIYSVVAADPDASSADRASARRELARIAWLIDGDRERALDLVARGLTVDPLPCEAALLYARILNDGLARSWPPALTRVEQQCSALGTGIALQRIRFLMLAARDADSRKRISGARAALAELAHLPASERNSALGARMQLSLGLLAEDASSALAGWRNYFWLVGERAAPQAFGMTDEAVIAAFYDGLREPSSHPKPLAALLIRAGFAEEYRAYRDRQPASAVVSDTDWHKLDRYIDLRTELAAAVLLHDRRFARSGPTEEVAYEAQLTAILAKHAAQIDPKGTDPRAVLHSAFGLWGTEPGKSNGVSGIHLGHTVIDERLNVQQDGRAGAVRLIVVDNMLHNSFGAWLMDGESAPGGWAVDGATIVQVRPRYLMLIDGYARLAQPGPARERADAEAKALRASDRLTAAKTPLSFLPGVRARLRLRGIDTLATMVRAEALPGQDFEGEFRRAYWDALVASSIVAHEGRHVLDQASYAGACELSNAELEYRAKLSEIRFATVPMLALSSIYSPLFSGESGHGIANRRLASDLAAWIAGHSSEVVNYDFNLAPLEQLDQLTDQQLVDIAKSLEPPDGPCDRRGAMENTE
jgi:hypothetical protein